MLEDPERLLRIVDAWLSTLPQATAGRARSASEGTHEVA
jgi:hypothetical protein